MNTIRTLISQSLVSLAVVSMTAVFAQVGKAETITGELGNIRAEISYEKPEEYQYKNVRLQIIRAGQTVLDQKLPQESEYDRPVGGLFTDNKLPILD
jgi:hypothetical protein